MFYPARARSDAFLPFYASVFPTVEIDNTFYRMPTERTTAKWLSQAPNLKFCIKANRLLTHEITDWKANATEFSKALEPLGDSLSAILFQFPQSFHRTVENRLYLASLLEAFASFPKVVEFRHKEWGNEQVYESLDKRDTGFCVCDMPSLSALPCFQPIVTGGIGYVRFHGRNADAWYQGDSSSRYAYEYTEAELKKTLPIITDIAAKSKVTHIFFNNHPAGAATIDAKTMMYLLSQDHA